MRSPDSSEGIGRPDWRSTASRQWSSAQSRARILVVDDDASVLALLRILLMSAGYEVVTAVDGKQALDLTEATSFDLILLDLEMPVMSGRQFFSEYKERENQAPVVVVSAYGAEAGRRELGAQAAVAKPFDPASVARVVDQILRR